jgi:hypothetical protein
MKLELIFASQDSYLQNHYSHLLTNLQNSRQNFIKTPHTIEPTIFINYSFSLIFQLLMATNFLLINKIIFLIFMPTQR